MTYYNDCVPLTPDLFVILVFSIRFQTTVLEAWTRFDRFKPKIKAVVVTDCLIISTLVIFYKYCNLWQLTNYLFWTCRYAASNYFSFGPIYLFLRFFFFFYSLPPSFSIKEVINPRICLIIFFLFFNAILMQQPNNWMETVKISASKGRFFF